MMDYLLHVSAFCLPLFLFTYWSTIGYALLSLLRSQRHTLQNLLLAPSVGAAFTLLPLFTLNRLGIPVLTLAWPVGIGLLLFSFIILAFRKPLFPIKAYLPFIGIFILALCLTGRPLLSFGFDWVSYSNDDMANYSFAATRLLHYGFFDIPSLEQLLTGKDYSVFYWFMHVPGMVRPGSEFFLAFVSALTGLNPLQIFMPVILTLHLMLISTAGALVCTRGQKNRVAMAACLLIAFSALTTLGAVYQLIAQVAGLGLFSATILLLFQPFTQHKKYGAFFQGILIAIMVSALVIVYPELAPFLAFAFPIYLILQYFKGWRINKTFSIAMVTAFILSLFMLNTHMIAVLGFVLTQANSTVAAPHSQIIIFPYYLLPSGLANLWGIQAIASYMQEPWMTLTIVLGALLTLIALIMMLRLVFLRAASYAIIMLVMVGVGIHLFKNNFGFGLFKLAMFIQPFLFCVIAISIFELIKSPKRQAVIILFFLLLGIHQLNYYVMRSKAETPGAFSEIAFASSNKLTSEYAQFAKKTDFDTTLYSDDFNVSLIKFQAIQSRTHEFYPLISPIIFRGYMRIGADKESDLIKKPAFLIYCLNKFFYYKEAEELKRAYLDKQYQLLRFDLHKQDRSTIDFFQYKNPVLTKLDPKHSIVARDSMLRSVINRQYQNTPSTNNFNFIAYPNIKNHLAFIDSYQGAAYSTFLNKYEVDPVSSFFNLENDYFYPHKTFQAVGRYLLFSILNPDPTFRVVLNITNSLDANGINLLPQTHIIGEKEISLSTIGRGSARLFSEPIAPQLINNMPYIAFDMQMDGKRFKHGRSGIMQLYGKSIPIDARNIVSFARNISLLSESEYQALDAPTHLQHFPADLDNNNLEYSGFYEDGWIGEEAFVVLKPSPLETVFTIRGTMPEGDDPTRNVLTISINGKKVLSQKISGESFDITLPVSEQKGARQRIDLHFEHWQHLPKGDGRPVSAKIQFIGFGKPPEKVSQNKMMAARAKFKHWVKKAMKRFQQQAT